MGAVKVRAEEMSQVSGEQVDSTKVEGKSYIHIYATNKKRGHGFGRKRKEGYMERVRGRKRLKEII